MDRLEQWRMFAAVASSRSFVKAAKALGRSPQAATRAVLAIEERIGTKLLHRTTRSVSLTDDGHRYLEQARRAIADLDLLETPVDADAATSLTLRGTISITAPVLFGQLHVVPVVTDLLATHPQLDARLLLLDRVVSLAEEGIDGGVRIGALPDSSLRARLVGHVRSVVCASPKYLERAGKPRDPSSLAKHACISWSGTVPVADRWSFRRAARSGGRESRGGSRRDASVSVRPRLIVNTGQAAIDAALAGLGVVRALSYQVDALVERGELQLLLRAYEPEPIPIHVVQLAGTRSKARSAFMDLVAERLRERAGALGEPRRE